MPRQCSICHSKSTADITLFQFPTNVDQRQKWANFAGISLESLRASNTICSVHFKSDSFKFTSKEGCERVLKENAVPVIRQRDEVFRTSISESQNASSQKNSKKYRTNTGNCGEDVKPRVTRICCICGALNAGISQFSFPKDPSVRSKWASFCGIEETKVKDWYRVCSKHFKCEDIIVGSNRSKLKVSAVPSVAPGNTKIEVVIGPVSNESGNISTPPEEISVPEQIEILQVPSTPVTHFLSSTPNEENNRNTHSADITTPTQLLETPVYAETDDMNMNITGCASRKRPFPRYLGDITTPQLETPKRRKRVLEIARETVKKLTVQKLELQRQNRNLKKKIITLEEAMENMKREYMLNQQQIDNIWVRHAVVSV